MSALWTRRFGRARGQAVAEFSIAILVFLVILMGVFDFGRGIYLYNGVAQAAREIARRTSVYPGSTLGASAQSQAVIAVQRNLVPGLGTPTFTCETVTGGTSTNDPCASGDFIRVTIAATYRPISMLGFIGNIPISASSSIQVP